MIYCLAILEMFNVRECVMLCSFFQKYGIVDSLCFPYIQRTALQACVIGNVQDHRAGVQMLMCIMRRVLFKVAIKIVWYTWK